MSAGMEMGPAGGIVVGSWGLLLGLVVAVGHWGPRWGWSGELQRKAIHLGLGSYALSFPWLLPSPGAVGVLCLGAALILAWLRHCRASWGAGLHRVGRPSWGEFYYCLAIVGVFYWSAGEPLYYVLPLGVLATGDALAALVGRRWGRWRYRVLGGDPKSFQGSAAFWLCAWLWATAALSLWPPAVAWSPGLLALLIASGGTALEAAARRGFDNAAIPLGLCGLLQGLTASHWGAPWSP